MSMGPPTPLENSILLSLGVGGALYYTGVGQSPSNKENKNILKKVQRTALTRTSTAYRAVSHAALCVLTGTMPIHLKAELRAENYEI